MELSGLKECKKIYFYFGLQLKYSLFSGKLTTQQTQEINNFNSSLHKPLQVHKVLMVSQVLTTKMDLILLEIQRFQQQQLLLQQPQLVKEAINMDNNNNNNLDKEYNLIKLLNILINSNQEISKDKTITDQWHELSSIIINEPNYFKLEYEFILIYF